MLKSIARLFGVTNQQQALRAKRRLAILYAIIGWHSFIIVFYLVMKRETPTDPAGRRQIYMNLTGTPKNMHVYRVTGLTFTEDFEVAYKDKLKQTKKEMEQIEEETTNTSE